MLTRIADNYDEDVDNAVAGVTSTDRAGYDRVSGGCGWLHRHRSVFAHCLDYRKFRLI